ncbi:MAG: diguanylate cyclase [Betaproteobacteria bacterium]|nr:diguanylate cyclase [Betaproteobacteria bacterium]
MLNWDGLGGFARSLRGQLLIASIAMLVISGVAISVVVMRFAERGLIAQVELSLNTVAAGVRSRIDVVLGNHYGQLDRVLLRDKLLGKRQRQARLDILQDSQPEYLWLGFVNADGRVTEASDGARVGQSIVDEAWFREAMEAAKRGAASAQGPMNAADPQAGGTLDIALPLSMHDPGSTEVLVARLSTSVVQALLKGARQTHFRAQGLQLMLVDGGGKLIAFSHSPDPAPASLFQSVAAGAVKDFAAWENWADGRHLTAYNALRGDRLGERTGWLVIARQDEASAEAPIRALMAELLILLCVTGLMVLLLAYWTGARIVRPVRELARTAERIRGGERDAAFPEGGRSGEMRSLAQSISSMVRALAASEAALKAQNESLEARVRRRTEELETVGAALTVERERLTLSLDGSHIAAWDANVRTGEIWLSAEWSAMLGQPRGESTTDFRHLAQLVAAQDRDRVTRLQQAVLRGDLPFYDVEHTVQRDDGSWFWIRSRGTVTARDASGRATRMTGTNSDITRRKLAEAELADSERKLKLVADNLPFMINFLDRDCRFLFANRRYLDFLGFTGRDVIGKTLKDVAGADAEAAARAGYSRLEAGEFVHSERERTDRHGRLRRLEITQIPHFAGEGALGGFFSIIEDITERREVERLVAAREAQLDLITRHVPVGICEATLDGRIVFANPHYHRLYQRPEGSLVGLNIFELMDDESEPSLMARREALIAGETVEYECAVDLPGRGPMDLNVSLVPRREQRGGSGAIASVYALVQDVTARNQVRELLRAQALSDSLTGLPNRRLLVDRLEQAIAHARRERSTLAVLYLDLDGFKPVNDAHGHAAGDQLLCELARRLKGAVREGDTVARLGGDEFVVLLDPCESVDAAAQVAEKLLAVVAAPVAMAETAVSVGVSIGIALFPRDGASAVALLDRADKSLYRAKAEGKGRYRHGLG